MEHKCLRPLEPDPPHGLSFQSEKEVGESSVQEALAEVEKDIAALKESAGAKESEVISAVISALV